MFADLQLRRPVTERVPGNELQRVLSSVTEIDGLLLLLAVLNYFVAGGTITHPGCYAGTIAAYGAVVFTLRRTPLLRRHPRQQLMFATTAMVVFITALLALSSGGRGPLLNLYLLPVITSALSLGRLSTIVQIALVVAARAFLNAVVDGGDVLTLSYGLSLLGETVPVIFVAVLTTSLARDIYSARQQLQTMADRDDLTGLLNMQSFARSVNDELGRAARRGGGFALLLVDVDGLKSVNDRFGHEAGDRTLVAVAQALKRSCRSVDLVGRYGGDEFLLLLSGAGPAIAKVVTNRIRHNLFAGTLELGGTLQRISVCIGAAVYPEHGRDLRDLVNAADKALGLAKAGRREPFAQPVSNEEQRLRAAAS